LRKNQDNLDRSIPKLATFVRIFTDNLGNGRWFDNIVQNVQDPTGLAGLTPGTFGDGTSRPLVGGVPFVPGVAK